MELITLPDFHHGVLLIIVAAVVVSLLWAIARRLPRRTPRFKIRTRQDLYEASRILSRYPHYRQLLHELRPYKYAPDAPDLPPDLRRRAEAAVREVLRQEHLTKIKEKLDQKFYNFGKKNGGGLLWKFLKMHKKSM